MTKVRKVQHHAESSSAYRHRSEKLRPMTHEETDAWSESEGEPNFCGDLCDLDEAHAYTFQQGDRVWVKTAEGNWYLGKVNGQTTRKGPTRKREGLFYPVAYFEGRMRRYFAPLNGEIKPDTRQVRHLLVSGGWVDEESLEVLTTVGDITDGTSD